jgi:hypothetical protein
MITPPAKPNDKRPKNRYEVEPQMGSRAERPEEKETRPDVEELTSEKGAAAPVDAAFAGSVSKYFNERRKVADVTDAQDTEYFDHDAFLAEEQRALEKLANPETAAKMKPKDVSFALGDLAGSMGTKNPEQRANVSGDPAKDAAGEKEHAETKKLFMDSAEKIFPNVAVDTGDMGNEVARTAERLSFEADASFIPDVDPKDLQRMYEQDPAALGRKLDEVLEKSGNLMQTRARMSFDLQDGKRRTEADAHLAGGMEMYYKLQLIRDAVREKSYGRKDITASEQRKVDEMRNAFSGKGAEEAKDDSAEAERGLAAVRDGGAGGEALREAWNGDGTKLSRRLDVLVEKSKTSVEMMLKDDARPISRGDATKLALRQNYGDLLPAERRAFEDAAKKEAAKRERDESPEAVSGEKLYVEFMTKQVREGQS